MKKFFRIAVLTLLTSAPSFGQLTVIDPASIRQQVQQLLQMQKELVQLQQTYALYQQQFNLLNAEAQSLKGLPSRYRYTFANWQQFAAGNQYGNTNTWSNVVATGDANSIQTAFRNLIPTIKPVDVTANSQAQQDWRQQYGLIQLQDASLMTGMKAIGDIRTNTQQNARALAQLEADATTTDPNLQSAKALQQKTYITRFHFNFVHSVLHRLVCDYYGEQGPGERAPSECCGWDPGCGDQFAVPRPQGT